MFENAASSALTKRPGRKSEDNDMYGVKKLWKEIKKMKGKKLK